MRKYKLFGGAGVHCVVDGSFGSTGKGLLSAWLAGQAHAGNYRFEWVVSNAGPNSGHTHYGVDGTKHVLKQLPSFAVASLDYTSHPPIVHLSAGAVIDPEILAAEALRYPLLRIWVHPQAAVVSDVDKAQEHRGTVAAVAGTRSGTGVVLARKILRDPAAVVKNSSAMHNMPHNVQLGVPTPGYADQYLVFMEVSQGFSLGIHSDFYPKVTSRECTVMQGIADARIPPQAVQRTYMSCRTYPIRVGNVDGHSSGDWYPDQVEMSWEDIGVEPERTTVTNRIRRVANFSEMQFREAVIANQPHFVFMNFMNYLVRPEPFKADIRRIRDKMPQWFDILWGYGPRNDGIHFDD